MTLPVVMFVDDEVGVLNGLRRLFRNKKDNWSMLFANSGAEALEIMEGASVDVLVTDMRMPGMDGAELLQQVADRFPVTVRIILSGQSDEETLLRTVGVSHQYLSKPCDSQLLEQKVSRALGLRKILMDAQLRNVIGGLRCIPSAPATYVQLVKELNSGSGFRQKLEDIVVNDPALTARLLQVVNSAYFGVVRDVRTAGQAMNLLGYDTLRALALEQGLIAPLADGNMWSAMISSNTMHSLRVAGLSRQLAQGAVGDAKSSEEAFTAGMLHDIGKWILAGALGQRYHAIMSEHHDTKASLIDLEHRELATDHCHVAAYLLALWGLPDAIVESALFHHNPRSLSNHHLDTPIFVWAANYLLAGKDGDFCSAEIPLSVSTSQGTWDGWRRQRDQFVKGDDHVTA
jgi:HD-like signal output (HDOD) protein/CheY-like chemotaxis protein